METLPKKEELPAELIIQSMVLSEAAIDMAEKEYHNDLMPFSQKKEQIKEDLSKFTEIKSSKINLSGKQKKEITKKLNDQQ